MGFYCIFGSNYTYISSLKIEIHFFIVAKILTSKMSYNMFSIMLITFCLANSLMKSTVMEIIDDFLHFWLRLYLNSPPQNWDTFFILFKILTFEMIFDMFSIMPSIFCFINTPHKMNGYGDNRWFIGFLAQIIPK